MRRVLLLLLASLVLVAPAAAAPTTIKKAIWGPMEVDGKSQFPVYEELGVGIYQYGLRWDRIAPTRPKDPTDLTDPAYEWPEEVDRAIREGRRHGIKVALMVLGAPEWANGGKPWNWAPEDPDDFATFIAAASRRYRGVGHWLVWGEPSKGSNFQPLLPDEGKPLRGEKELEGPRRYAQILDASYGALKTTDKRDLVIGGNTFTVGTVAPLRYLKAMRLPGGGLPRMDLYGHNAFSARKPDLGAPPLGQGFADFSDLDQLAKRLDRTFRKAPLRKMRRLKIFISEYTVPTDHRNHEFNFFESRRTAASWISAALRITRTFKRIYTFGYLGLYDAPQRPDGDQTEWGLIQRDGTRKPSFRAFAEG